ncbi:MAG: tRNA lysidine(34) synthetase TilS [Sporolactobacillus sp.]
MTFEEEVTRFIEDHHLIHPNMRLVAGVSGGADSMALLAYLIRKRKEWALELAVICVDHGLRANESRADLEFVASFCKEEQVVFFDREVDTASFAREQRLSQEAAARKLRYQAFREVLHLFQADALALAHHGDDQVETMLMHQVRGSVGLSKAGIPVNRSFAGCQLIRPFLTHTKAELEAYCERRGIRFREDATNKSDAHTRNRFRKYVLPFLKKENPAVHLKFQYESECLAADETYLLDLARQQMDRLIKEKGRTQIALSVHAFLSVPLPLQRRVIHLILSYLYEGQNIKPLHESIHIENLLQLLRSGRASGSTSFPSHLIARKSYDSCRIGFLPPNPGSYETELSLPGETMTPAGIFHACLPDKVIGEETASDQLLFDRRRIALPLRIRTWHPGDRIATVGMEGTQKIQRIFINEKIDRMKRSLWPLVVDAEGAVIWLPMLRKARLAEPVKEKTAVNVLVTFVPLPILGGRWH